LDQIADVGVSPSRNLTLISREIIFEVLYSNLYDLHTGTSQTDWSWVPWEFP